MKKLLLLLLLLSPLVQAADWLSWRTVGQATLTWGAFTAYDSQLLTPNGRWQPQQWQAQKIGSSSQQRLQQLGAI